MVHIIFSGEQKMSAKKEDIRIVKTKKALTDAFFVILTEMPLDEVKVNDLCERADVRRATFYKHFKDKTDFVTYLIKDVRARFDNEVWQADLKTTITKEYYIQYAEAIINYLLDRDTAIKNIIDSPVRSVFFDLFLHENYEDTVRRLEASKECGVNLIAPTEVMASMIVGGIAHVIIKWFDASERCPVENLLDYISSFIEKIFA